MVEQGRNVMARAVELVSLAPFYERFCARVEGLTDEEYLWEPVQGCLTVRPGETGSFVTGGPAEPARLTRLLGGCAASVTSFAMSGTGGGSAREPELRDIDIRHPLTADGGIGYVDDSWSAWQRLVSSLTPEEMWELIGPIAGPYAESERIGFVVHILDELIHHAAEVGVMRDLYAATRRS